MLKIGNLVMYGSIGLCKVADIANGTDNCILQPVYVKSGQMLVSFEREQRIREILSKDEILSAIETAKNSQFSWYPNPDMRAVEYRQAVNNADYAEWLRLFKVIRFVRAKGRKDIYKPQDIDGHFLKIFSKLTSEEYGYVLGMTPEEAARDLRRLMK